jgi:hypothetical protein
MRFQTPQFIDIEDRIFGPLTLKQFIYLAGSAGLAFLFYRTLPFILALWLIIPTIGLGLALAFFKFNNKPFIFLLEALFRYSIHRKLYLWRKGESAPTETKTKVAQTPASGAVVLPKLSHNKLKDLAWNLDVSKQAREGRQQR